MSIMENSIHSNSLSSLTHQAGAHVTGAIRQASAKTGVDFAYLMNQAAVESSFKPNAKAKTSSAAGLYQFIEKTWMKMVKTHGDQYGLGQYADKIDTKGRVSDPAMRKEILSLRNDPHIASVMAAEFASENQRYLERHTDGAVGATELYLAHFMGAGGASGFLNAMQKNPLQAAADIFPEAANANRAIFYSKSGAPRSLAEVYDVFAKKFEGISAEQNQIAVAAAHHQEKPVSIFSINDLLENSVMERALPPPNLPPQGGERIKEGGNDVAIWQQWTTSIPSPAFTRQSLSVDPVEIMLLAQLND
jgi:hypothetical protein